MRKYPSKRRLISALFVLLPVLAVLPAQATANGTTLNVTSNTTLTEDFYGNVVIAKNKGGPLHYRNLVRRGLDKAADAAGINPPKPPKGEKPAPGTPPRLRWHDLRHACASLLISEGCDPVYVARVLGHASPGFTLSAYSHLFDAERHADRVSAALEGRFGGMLC